MKSPKISLLLGDTVERLRQFPEGSLAACVVDPPYGLEFMGKEWDRLDVPINWQSSSGFSAPGIGDRAVARKRRGSANRRRAVVRVARQHYRVSCVRRDAIQQASAAIAKRAKILVIESLNVAGMLRNHHLAGALSDASMAEFLRCLRYKVGWHGGQVKEADRFYPSSKTCSRCGAVKESLSLNERTFRCETCGHAQDRDENAARNLRNLARSSRVTACGGLGRSAPPVKQEPNTTSGPSWIGG